MNITLTINGDTAEEIKNAVQYLSDNLGVNEKGDLLKTLPEAKLEKPKAKKKEAVQEAKPVEKPEDENETSEESATDENAPDVKISFEQIRKKSQEKLQENKHQALKDLLVKYNIKRVTEVQKEQYAEFFNDLKEL